MDATDFVQFLGSNHTIPVRRGLSEELRLLRRCAPRNDKERISMSLRAIRRIARQSQVLQWDLFNSPALRVIEVPDGKKLVLVADNMNQKAVVYIDTEHE